MEFIIDFWKKLCILLFWNWLNDICLDKPANRKKNVQNNQALNISSLQNSFSNSFNSSSGKSYKLTFEKELFLISVNQSLNQSHDGSFDQLSQSILSQASLLNPDLQSLIQQSISGNNSLLNGGAASLAGLASSLSNLNQSQDDTEKKETASESVEKIKRETPSPCTKYRQGKTKISKSENSQKYFSSKSAQWFPAEDIIIGQFNQHFNQWWNRYWNCRSPLHW